MDAGAVVSIVFILCYREWFSMIRVIRINDIEFLKLHLSEPSSENNLI